MKLTVKISASFYKTVQIVILCPILIFTFKDMSTKYKADYLIGALLNF